MPAKAGISCGSSATIGPMRGGWTYIMASKPRGVLYIGVTAYLAQRIDQNRRGAGSAFCRRYNLRTLVLADSIEEAIAREKALKAWRRAWKIKLIEETNPDWRDLFDVIA